MLVAGGMAAAEVARRAGTTTESLRLRKRATLASPAAATTRTRPRALDTRFQHLAPGMALVRSWLVKRGELGGAPTAMVGAGRPPRAAARPRSAVRAE